jgi:hypothetical protein
LILGGAVIGLLRLLAGLWAVRQCWRRARPVEDGDLRLLAESLCREIGCPPVAVRESSDLATPATVGWLRPLVLLPADWRGWSPAERRTALAHELAHVRRRDYLAGLLARLGVALHFYHPLLHWLAGRLHLQQELAADALAAPLAGGRGPYLRSLARLALRPGGRPAGWPVNPLFSTRGTLLRRIDMLRAKSPDAAPASRWTTFLVVGVVALCAAPLSVLRSPARAETDGSQPTQPASADKSSAAKPEPLDLSYLPPDAPGALALRPAALLRRPALAGVGQHLQEEIEGLLNVCVLNGKGRLHLRMEEVEQLTARMCAEVDPKKKENKRSLMFSLVSIRCAHDFDWKGQMREFYPGAVEVPHAGGVFYRCAIPKNTCFPKGGDLTWWVPDGRTLIMDSEKNLRRLLERKGRQDPPPAWAEGWRRVEGCLAAGVFDTREGRISKLLDADDKAERGWIVPLGKMAWVTAGWSADGGILAVAECESEKGSEQSARAVRTLLGVCRLALSSQSSAGSGDAKGKSAEDGLAEAFLSTASLKAEGSLLLLRAETKGLLEEALKVGLAAAAADEKAATPAPKQ